MKNNSDELISKFLDSPEIKKLCISNDIILSILRAYNDVAFNTLLENGHVELGNDMILEVVQLVNRVHVLRGTPYKNNRRYKLKLTMEDNLYKKIEDYYDKLQEDIG